MKTVLCFITFVCLVKGHGNIVKPAYWGDSKRDEWYLDKNGESTGLACGSLKGQYPINSDMEAEFEMDIDCLPFYFSNKVTIPGNATIPHDHSQPDCDCGHRDVIDYPWMAPGSAPVFSPCGALGGLPNGCNNDGVGNFGDFCCDGKCDCNCGSFAKGDLAQNYEWPQAPSTQWKAGSIEEVAWYLQANHAGGYAYRLCKTPVGGIKDLTEECFQNGHLEFDGVNQWVEYNADKGTKKLTELKAQRLTEGTFPPGSMWTEVPFCPWMKQDFSPNRDPIGPFGHIVDNVRVPSSLEPGQYVLSMRYDCKCTPEVFSFCSNIEIVE